jgi:hypothetical protein
MCHFPMETDAPTGSNLSANQRDATFKVAVICFGGFTRLK